MKVAIRIIVALIIIAILMVGALAGYMTYLFDPNEYKAEIEKQAKQKAGIELAINGPIGWSLYPTLAVELSDISAQLGEPAQRANLNNARAIINIPALLNGQIEADSIQIKGLMLSVENQDKSNLDLSIDLTTALKFDTEQQTLTLSNIDLRFDESRFNGSANVDLNSLAMQVDLTGDRIDLDRYLPSSSTETTNTSSEKGWPTDPIEISLPIADNSTYRLSLDTLIVKQQTISDIKLNAKTAGGVLTVEQLEAKAFGGSLNATAEVRANNKVPTLVFNPSFKDIAAEQLMALAMENPILSAKVDLAGTLSTKGTSVKSFIENLNGKMTLTADEGVIKGIDMAQELCQKIENITSLGFNPDQVDKTTPIANLNSDFIIKNGVVTNPELLASVDAANLDANGTINLPKQSLDYTLGLTIKEDLFQKSCGINPALRGTRIPVNCRGAFDTDPVKLCKLDTRFVGDMLKKVAGEKLQAEIDKKKEALEQQAKEKLQDSLKDKLGEQLKSQDAGSLIKGLFGN
jgi:AsmA protein